jgi:serine/threonine protein kinase
MPEREEQTLTGGLEDTSYGEATLTGGLEDEYESLVAGENEWKIGSIIDGKYEVLDMLGRGAMGIVYKVRHREWDLDLAVKMPLSHLLANPEFKARFTLEAQTWVDLGLHPNIVQCWYVRELAGIPRVFMDYLEGGSLKDWIKQGKVSPGEWAMILDLVIQA